MEEDMAYSERKIAGMYRIVFFGCLSFLLACCNNSARLPYYNDPSFSPHFIDNPAQVDSEITHRIGPFSFLNQDSVLFSSRALDGKIHLANFMFTSCGSICPQMTQNLKIVHDELKQDSELIILSFTVTPWIDRPHILKNYCRINGIESGNWHFLSGNKGAIYSLARTSYFAEEEMGYSKDSTEFLHTEHVLLIDKQQRIRGIYNGTLSLEMKQLIDDIRILKQED